MAELQKRTGNTEAPSPPTIDHEGTEYTALWDYQGQGDDDLSFQANDIVLVKEATDTEDWWYGTLKHSQKAGYFPRSYVDKAGGQPIPGKTKKER